MKNIVYAALVTAGLCAPLTTFAAPIVLDFEGLSNISEVGDFYNGGAGTNYGVQLSGDTLAIIDQDAGENGNFANEPSANTTMFFLDSNSAILNFSAGFDTGFSFFYSSLDASSVNVYDGLNGTGNLLASLVLVGQHSDNCSGDPTGDYCNWTAVGVDFVGTAKSIDFSGTANYVGFDNITFGSSTPSAVPIPAAAWLFGSGLMGLFGLSRRKTV